MSKRMRFTLQAVVAVLLAGLLLRQCEFDKLAGYWQGANVWLWPIAGLVSAACITLGCSAVVLLADTRGRGFALGQFYLDYGFVQALALLTPGRAAEGGLAFVNSRGQVAPGEMLAALLTQRLVQMVLLVVFALLCSIAWAPGTLIWAAAVGGLAIPVAVAAAVACRPVRDVIGGIIVRFTGPVFHGFYASWQRIWAQRKRQFALHVFVMGLRIVLGGLSVYLVLISLGVNIPFVAWLGIVSAAMLTTLVPISFWGIGLIEGASVIGLAQFGHGADLSVAVWVVWRSIHVFVLLAWVACHWIMRTCERAPKSSVRVR